MDFITSGKVHHPEYRVELFTEQESIIKEGTHTSFRLLVMESGSFILNINDCRLFVEAPAVLCLNNTDNISNVQTDNLLLSSIYFKPLIINSVFGEKLLSETERQNLSFTEDQDYRWLFPFFSKNISDRYIRVGPSVFRRVRELAVELADELDQQSDLFWPCRSRSFFLEILYALNNVHSKYDGFKHSVEEESQPIEKILLYLHSHYRENISLEQLAKKFAVNRTKLNKMFVDATGETAINYLISLRIKLACLILRDTMRPVKEVAFQTGFSDITHFGRTFKRHINCSPSQYREDFNWMLE